MRVIDTLRILPSGSPVAPGTQVQVFRESDNTLLDTVVTDANGAFTFEVEGNPGTVRYEAVAGASNKVHSTRTVMPVGQVDMSALPALLNTFLDGVVINYKDALSVVADGVSMDVAINPGVATAKGVIYKQDDPLILTIPPATDNPRIDTIVVRFWRAETGDNAGRCEIVRRQGVEGVSPTPYPPLQNETTWDTPLAQVRVDPGVLGISMNKVTDTRLVSIPLIPNGTITKDQLADDVAFGIPYVKNGNTNVVVENADRLNFMSSAGFTASVNSSIDSQVDVGIDFPTANTTNGTSSKPSREDHLHNMAVIDRVIVGARDLSSSVNEQSMTSIKLPAEITRCMLRVVLRVEGGLGTTAEGSLFMRVAGANHHAFGPYQCDQGVDSTIEAVATYTTSGGTSLNVGWGWNRSAGTLRVKHGWIEWICIPRR